MAQPVLMSPWIPVIAAFGGSLITGFINLIMNQFNKRAEERKHYSSLIIQAAIENWKQALDSTHKIKSTGKKRLSIRLMFILFTCQK